MFENRRQIYEDTLTRWPSKFRILPEKSHVGQIFTNPDHLREYGRIEKSIEPSDEWMQISSWSFYQALINRLEMTFANNGHLLDTHCVTFEDFDLKMVKNLQDESWSVERDIYDRLP